jgi:hypothetical protein
MCLLSERRQTVKAEVGSEGSNHFRNCSTLELEFVVAVCADIASLSR